MNTAKRCLCFCACLCLHSHIYCSSQCETKELPKKVTRNSQNSRPAETDPYENANTNKHKNTNNVLQCSETEFLQFYNDKNTLQLLAALLGATAMATWHAALFMEMEKIHEPGFPLTWPEWLQVQTRHFISNRLIMHNLCPLTLEASYNHLLN